MWGPKERSQLLPRVYVSSPARSLRMENYRRVGARGTQGCKALTISLQEDRFKLVSIWGSRNHKIIELELTRLLETFKIFSFLFNYKSNELVKINFDCT